MAVPIMSRSQRRLEKNQALVLLALVLAVSLVSFTLGVMVGKNAREPVAAAPPPPERRPVIPPRPETGGQPLAAVPAAEDLTFYDTLPKGEQPPLGSGINLAPPEKTTPQEAIAAEKSAPSVPSAVEPAPAKAVPAKPAKSVKAEAPAAAAKGNWTLQVASFQEPGEARKLQEHLGGKGYAASVRQADLGAKGKWYRVVVGPYESEAAAAKAAARLKSDEKLSALVRKG